MSHNHLFHHFDLQILCVYYQFQVLEEVKESAEAATKIKLEVQGVKDKAQRIVDAIDIEKQEAERKLEAAKPALEEAEEALKVNKSLTFLLVLFASPVGGQSHQHRVASWFRLLSPAPHRWWPCLS